MEDQVLAVQRMQEYIEEHLSDAITLAQLSEASRFSPWHSHRLFKEYTGFTPAEYIRRLRLSRSALRLRDESIKVIDAALDMGFGSPDGYTRAFYREFGVSPREYACHPVPIQLFIPYGVKFRFLQKESGNMEKTQNIFIQVIEKPARKVIIKRGIRADDYFSYCQEVGCDVWGTLTSIKSPAGEPVCMWLPEAYVTPGTSVYVQGAEVPADFSGTVPEGFDVIGLPGGKYLMFQGEPFHEEDYCEAISALQRASAGYDPSVIGYAWDSSRPRIQLEPRGVRGYIELYPVKPLNK